MPHILDRDDEQDPPPECPLEVGRRQLDGRPERQLLVASADRLLEASDQLVVPQAVDAGGGPLRSLGFCWLLIEGSSRLGGSGLGR